ncbi:MAG: NAD(P)H-dependent oxidoreductase subunit E [Desulfobacteraceae bacterium]|nr:NAD(P)H-dependent oxidoreductase subunit E [Desulfobacteraceae bacterium]
MTTSDQHIDELMDQYPPKPEYLIGLLQDIQDQQGYISYGAMLLASEHTKVPLSQAYSVATFYQSFRLDPPGEHEIKVCLGTACHLNGGQQLVDGLSRKLQIEPGETTDDMMFTLSTVNCVGACAIAPVAVVDENYHAGATMQKLEREMRKVIDLSSDKIMGEPNA